MANYEYHGCVTGFSESDTVTLWQPDVSPLPVDVADAEYPTRLLDMSLLTTDVKNTNHHIDCIATSFTPDSEINLSHFDYPSVGGTAAELVLGTLKIGDKSAVFAIVVGYDERDDLSGGFLLGSGFGYGLNMHTEIYEDSGTSTNEARASAFYQEGKELYNELYQRIIYKWQSRLYYGRNDYQTWESFGGIGTSDEDKAAYADLKSRSVDSFNFQLSQTDILITRATSEVIKLAQVYLSTITYTGQLEPLKFIEAVDILNGGEDIVVHSCLRALPTN